MVLEGAQQRADGVGGELDVVVQQQDDRLVEPREDAVERRQPPVRLADDPHLRPVGRDQLERAVGRAVVDDRHRAGDGRPRGRLDDRGQALVQQVPAVVVEDQDVRAVDRHGFHPSDWLRPGESEPAARVCGPYQTPGQCKREPSHRFIAA